MSQVVVTTPQELESIVAQAVRAAVKAVMAETQSRYLSEDEAAQVLGKSPATLRTLRCRGKGPAYTKDGGRVMYDRHDIEAHMSAHKIRTRGN